MFPKTLREIAGANNDPSAKMVFIDTPAIIMSMGAAVFINNKPIIFGGPTNYGPAYDQAGQRNETVALFSAPCAATSVKSFKLQDMALSAAMAPALPTGFKVLFSAADQTCVNLRGFGGAESWGRWTNGSSADILFRCICDEVRDIKVILEAHSLVYPGIRDRQRVMFDINGVRHVETFDSNAQRRLEFSVPVDAENGDVVAIHMELPDAVSPHEAGSVDTRLLGLGVVSLEVLSVTE